MHYGLWKLENIGWEKKAISFTKYISAFDNMRFVQKRY